LSYIGIVYALGFGWLFFDESFNWLTYLGMGLVILGVAGNIVFKSLKGL
jgi:drug/metabolite transporter (DMT)-like permease